MDNSQNNNGSAAGHPPVREHRPSEVIYQVYPASFADSDGDGHGDLKGVTAKLPYIKSLAADAIWISPFYLAPEGPDGDGGYAVTDHKKIDPKFGTMEDFQELLKAAHDMGLRVYTDFVLPHTASDHEWFQKSLRREAGYEDFYVWHDGSTFNNQHVPPNNWKSVFGGDAWTFDTERNQYYLHHFLKSQPALNLNKTEVQDAVLGEMKFWLDMGVDGFRIDSLPYANFDPQFRNNSWLYGQWPHVHEAWDQQRFDNSICQPQTVELVERIRNLMDSYTEKKTTLGEAIAGPVGGRDALPVAADYVHKEKGLDSCYSDVSFGISQSSGVDYLKSLIRRIQDHFPDGGHCASIGNHDNVRTWARVTEHLPKEQHEAAFRQIVKLFMTLPGSLCILQGEELGLPQARIPEDIPVNRLQDPVAQTLGIDRCRDGARTPMPWEALKKNAGFSPSDNAYLPVPQSHVARAVDRQEADPDSTLNFTRRMLSWRRAQPALMLGDTIVLDTQAPILALLRRTNDQTMLCAFNLSPQPASFKPSDFLDDKTLQNIGVKADEVMTVEGYGSGFSGARPWVAPHPVAPHAQNRLAPPRP